MVAVPCLRGVASAGDYIKICILRRLMMAFRGAVIGFEREICAKPVSVPI